MYSHGTFTSESVCAGHPDKVCDRISDAILDEFLRHDPDSHVAIETMAAKDHLCIAGEVGSKATVDYVEVARREIKRLGYADPSQSFDSTIPIAVSVHEQSPEIARGVHGDTGAGDQGMMFGFACKETDDLMPLPISMAHALTRRIDHLRESGELPYLLPDGKSQVTIAYENGRPTDIRTIVIAVPHMRTVDLGRVRRDIYQLVANPIALHYGRTLSEKNLIVNGTGVWHVGGPASDCGLTGRKIVVDTYGGYARVGGGAFSGKDPSKVDRSGAYAARYIAKNIVAAGLAERAEVRLAYCIGMPNPIMKEVETFGTETTDADEIKKYADKLLDCTPAGIIRTLKLRRPVYVPTSSYGHFGGSTYSWEKIAH